MCSVRMPIIQNIFERSFSFKTWNCFGFISLFVRSSLVGWVWKDYVTIINTFHNYLLLPYCRDKLHFFTLHKLSTNKSTVGRKCRHTIGQLSTASRPFQQDLLSATRQKLWSSGKVTRLTTGRSWVRILSNPMLDRGGIKATPRWYLVLGSLPKCFKCLLN